MCAIVGETHDLGAFWPWLGRRPWHNERARTIVTVRAKLACWMRSTRKRESTTQQAVHLLHLDS